MIYLMHSKKLCKCHTQHNKGKKIIRKFYLLQKLKTSDFTGESLKAFEQKNKISQSMFIYLRTGDGLDQKKQTFVVDDFNDQNDNLCNVHVCPYPLAYKNNSWK